MKHLNTKAERTFYFSACNTCKSDEVELKLCSGCKLVSYCSLYHQKMDWKDHKGLCQVVQKTMKDWNVTNIFGTEEKSASEWKYICCSLVDLMEKQLSRPLRLYEKQMFLFPKVCKVCYSAKVNNLYKCSNCKYCYYCCCEHKEQHFTLHRLECFEIQKAFKRDRMFHLSSLSIGGLDSYKLPIFNKESLPPDIEYFFDSLCETDELTRALMSDSISGALSLLSSIYSVPLYVNSELESLMIHVVGASSYELGFIKSVELLFHGIPQLYNTTVILIGPEVKGDIFEISLCCSCKSKSLTILVVENLYHEFFASESYLKPNVVIAFNCGFSEFAGVHNDSWGPTISCIMNLRNVVFVFTSYTKQEAVADWERVQKLSGTAYSTNLCVIKQHIYNPFRSLNPQRNWECDESDLFYLNYYISVMELQ